MNATTTIPILVPKQLAAAFRTGANGEARKP
jgi:hypothetical protein